MFVNELRPRPVSRLQCDNVNSAACETVDGSRRGKGSTLLPLRVNAAPVNAVPVVRPPAASAANSERE